MKTRITCLLLAAMLLVALPACGRAAQPANAPGADKTSAETEALQYSTEPASYKDFTTEDETEGETTMGGESANKETTAEDETSKAEIIAPVGGSVAQIVEFYNKQANAVKTAEKITIQKHDVREMTMDVPAIVRALMPKDMGDFDPNKDEKANETLVNGKGTKNSALRLNDFMPVSGQPFVSKLKASYVQSASCAKQGEGWIVTIKLNDEPMDMSNMNAMNADMSEEDGEKLMKELIAKSGYGACMDIGFDSFSRDAGQDQQSSRNFDPSSVKMEGMYQNGVIIAVFDKEGQLISLTQSHTTNTTMSFIGIKMKTNSTAKQEYQLTW